MRDLIKDALLIGQRREETKAQHPVGFEPTNSRSQDVSSTDCVANSKYKEQRSTNRDAKVIFTELSRCSLTNLIGPGLAN